MCSVKDRLCCYKQILECIYEPKTIFPQKKVKGTSYIMKVSRRVVRNPAIAFNNRRNGANQRDFLTGFDFSEDACVEKQPPEPTNFM